MSLEKDRIFFRNYSIVIGLLLVTIIGFLLAAVMLGSNDAVLADRQAETVADFTAPVGQIRTPQAADHAAQQAAAEAEPMAPAEAAAQEPVAAQQTAASDSSTASEVNGQQVYRGICASCHGTGLPGVPQLGDATAWQQRVDEKGMDTLYQNAINGFMGTSGMPMPAKGGNPSLSNEEVRAAVDYMVSGDQ